MKALFTAAEPAFNAKLRDALVKAGFEVFLPQEECEGLEDEPEKIYDSCIYGVETSDFTLANVDGPDADSGTCFDTARLTTGKPADVIPLPDKQRINEKRTAGPNSPAVS